MNMINMIKMMNMINMIKVMNMIKIIKVMNDNAESALLTMMIKMMNDIWRWWW